MKIENKGEAFEIRYDSKDLTVPKGEMDVANEGFATHILKKARDWGLNVIKIGQTDTRAIQPIEPIKTIVEEKQVETEVKAEVKKPAKK